MSKGDYAGIADHQINRERIEDVDQNARTEREVFGQVEKRCHAEQPWQPFDETDSRRGAVATVMSHGGFSSLATEQARGPP